MECRLWLKLIVISALMLDIIDATIGLYQWFCLDRQNFSHILAPQLSNQETFLTEVLIYD